MKGRNNVAASAKGLPEFTYTGTYQTIDDGNENWRIKFLTSGTLTFTKLKGAKKGIDVFLVGGGGGGGHTSGGGGGGGYTKTVGGIPIEKGTAYPIDIGSGGTTAARGGTSSAFDQSADGGYGGVSGFAKGGTGGSGGGGGVGDTNTGGYGGSDGGKGGDTKHGKGANGQGTSTREFWSIDQDASATLYAGGGGGGAGNGTGGTGGSGGGGSGRKQGQVGYSGTANTGGGGGGSGNTQTSTGGTGGSGIIVIRNARG